MRFKKFIVCLLLLLCVSSSAWADNGEIIVHRTRTGECYHKANCSYLKSDIEVTLREAVNSGLRPCSRCKPPQLDTSNSSGSSGAIVGAWNDTQQIVKTPSPVQTHSAASLQTPEPVLITNSSTSHPNSAESRAIGPMGYAAAAGLGGFLIGRRKKNI